MSHQCPKCCAALPRPAAEMQRCPACHIYFAKYRAWQEGQSQTPPTLRILDEAEAPAADWRNWLLPQRAGDRLQRSGWSALLLLMLVWGGYFISRDWRSGEIMDSFLHRPDLVFHEAGHVLFLPLGEFMSILGGSLFQCLVPLIAAIAFLRRRDPAAAAAAVWWMGQNVLDVAPYIADARALQLPLIGESSEEMVDARILRHDWHNILERLDLLEWDMALGRLAWLGGTLLMLLACGWLGYLVWRQWAAHDHQT